MSSYGANPISLIKKIKKYIKIGLPEHLLPPPPHPQRPITSHFCLTHPLPPLKVDVICVSLLISNKISRSFQSSLKRRSTVILQKCLTVCSVKVFPETNSIIDAWRVPNMPLLGFLKTVSFFPANSKLFGISKTSD